MTRLGDEMKVLSKTCGILLAVCSLYMAGCSGDSDGRTSVAEAQSCMTCHNGSPEHNDYSGPGLENPHPFPGADQLLCTTCHGESISPGIASAIAERYPDDEATGFAVGDLRGVFWVEFPTD